MNVLTNESLPVSTKENISQIVQSIPGSEALFKSYGLDSNQYSNESLRAVCFQNKWDEEFLLDWIWDECRWKEKLSKQPEKIHTNSPLKALEIINEKYYLYLTDRLTRIRDLFGEIQMLHGNQYTQLKTMKWYVEPFIKSLRSYIDRMQNHLFPLLKKQRSFNRTEEHSATPFDTTLTELKREQKKLQNLSETLIQKSKEFKNPGLACTRHRILNYYLDTVCSMMQEQLDAENEYILRPLSKLTPDYSTEFQFPKKE